MGAQSFLHNLFILSNNVVVTIWIYKQSNDQFYAFTTALLTINMFMIVPLFALNSTVEILIASALGAR
jgi:Na+-driven multidrug efflux pump